MSPFVRIVLIAAATVLLYDAVAATASRVLGFAYGSASVGSWLIYAGAGFFATRATGSLWMGALAAAAAGLVDSTAGWLISAWIGPGAAGAGCVAGGHRGGGRRGAADGRRDRVGGGGCRTLARSTPELKWDWSNT